MAQHTFDALDGISDSYYEFADFRGFSRDRFTLLSHHIQHCEDCVFDVSHGFLFGFSLTESPRQFQAAYYVAALRLLLKGYVELHIGPGELTDR